MLVRDSATRCFGAVAAGADRGWTLVGAANVGGHEHFGATSRLAYWRPRGPTICVLVDEDGDAVTWLKTHFVFVGNLRNEASVTNGPTPGPPFLGRLSAAGTG